ncbi:MAG: hypothetical protein KGQ37_09350 [Hyphomicrobiales bacterium]|nr:hypothetical protein [Hyphomicrobiales bacterium]
MTDATMPAAGSAPGKPVAGEISHMLGSLATLRGALIFAFFTGIIFGRGQIIAVWQHGTFFDTDDAMRLAQTRAWLAGQGWFDLYAHRLGPAPGTLMHWSRLVDVPIGLLLHGFGLVFSAATAERLTRITLPLALYGVLLALCLTMLRRLAGQTAVLIGAVLLALSGATQQYFQAGRLDHDDIAIILLVATLAALLRAFDQASRYAATVSGALVALQLAVSLETLPFAIVCAAAMPLAYMVTGAPLAANLRRFALALMLGLVACLVVTVPASRYFVAACDDYSIAHLVPGLIGAGLCVPLSVYAGEAGQWRRRLVAGSLCGLAVIAVEKWLFPACLGDPLGHVDPFLRHIWLPHVREAEPFLAYLKASPREALPYILPLVLGLCGAVVQAIRSEAMDRLRWALIALMIAAGIAVSFYAVRGLGEVLPLSILGVAALLTPLSERLVASGKAWSGFAMVGLCMVCSPLNIAWPGAISPRVAERQILAASCNNAEAFAPLAALPHGTILTPFDIGAMFLARTSLRVLAAPFHRDAVGMKTALATFGARPDIAKIIARNSGATYLAYCPGATDIRFSEHDALQSLASQLEKGHVPGWLRPLHLATPLKVLAILPPRPAAIVALPGLKP